MTRSMQTMTAIGLALTLAGAGSPCGAQATLAVAGFETDGSVGLTRPEYDALARALTVLLGSEIGAHSRATVLEIRAAGAVRMGRVDVAKARAAAAQAGAKFLVVGTLIDQYGDSRMEARLLNAATGDPVSVIRADKGHSKREHAAEAISDLAIGLGKRTELGGEKDAPERGAISVEALIALGQGLRLEDEGDRAKAADSFRTAARLSPALSEATTALRRVGG